MDALIISVILLSIQDTSDGKINWKSYYISGKHFGNKLNWMNLIKNYEKNTLEYYPNGWLKHLVEFHLVIGNT